MDVQFAAPLIPESPHCNKLIPLLDAPSGEHQAVADCDLFFFRDIGWFLDPDRVRLPPNNHAVPPLEVFQHLFGAAGIDIIPEPGLSLFKGAHSRETYAGNVSAGLIFVPHGLAEVASEWLDTARWLSANKEMFKGYEPHVDQISLAMTVAKSRWPFSFLPAQTNAILELLPAIRSLYGLHLTSGHIPMFEKWFADDGTLNWNLINPGLQDDLEWFNDKVREAQSLISAQSETAHFATNFLNPNWIR